MPYDWTAENLEEMFKAVAALRAVVTDQTTRRSKGFGFVEFELPTMRKRPLQSLMAILSRAAAFSPRSTPTCGTPE